MAEQQTRPDIEGEEIITDAIMTLLNQYPGLSDGDEIAFCKLNEDNGIAMFPTSGAVIVDERVTITGRVIQQCSYPFYVVQRTSSQNEKRMKYVKEWLDNLGRWLEGNAVKIGETIYKLEEYPALSQGRKFLEISRQGPSYLDSVDENYTDNWAISISATYVNDFYR